MRDRALLEAQVAVRAAPEGLEALHALLESFWVQLGQVEACALPQRSYLAFTTAVLEIATNIIRHAYADQARPGTLRLRLRASVDGVEAQFTDRGVPFAYFPGPGGTPLGPPLDVVDLPEGGYGLAVACAALDHVEYRRTPSGLNRWRLRRRCPDRAC